MKDWSIPFLSVVKASVFVNCCFLAANFEHLLIHDHLKKAGLNPQTGQALLKRLGYTSYPASYRSTNFDSILP